MGQAHPIVTAAVASPPAGPRVSHLLYLHGFRSSPQSAKARQVADRVARCQAGTPGALQWWCPQLPPSPREAMQMVRAGVADWPLAGMAVIGSSLGGYYATALAEDLGCRAVLLNPAIHPARDLHKYIGEQTSWHDTSQRFRVEPHFMDELLALQRGALRVPQQYFCVMAKGDEVLDWREMLARYAASQVRLLEGSDHGLTDFDQHIDAVFAFLGW